MRRIPIHFFSEDILFTLPQKGRVREWLLSVIEAEGYQLRSLNFIFCSDAYLLTMNQQYLRHDTYTDVITFDQSEEDHRIVGDIFISIERTADNAKAFGIHALDELHRVMVHGTLHLLGYPDKKAAEKKIMRQKEDLYLGTFPV
ncbi:MAG: rRNA maturation RNase YbeY [Mucilaginibacter polytrichastri]|nr:rRNA maturation RNase YbeY [Mucilaginibacter polytrichastri]